MSPNATLLKPHFVWNPGTRVEALHYWNGPEHITALLPATDKKPYGSCWVLPTAAVVLDAGVTLNVVCVDTRLIKPEQETT